MTRYIRRFGRIGFSLGPSEERGFAMWIGYDIEGTEADLTDAGFIRADTLSAAELAARGVTSFQPVAVGDRALRKTLGIEE